MNINQVQPNINSRQLPYSIPSKGSFKIFNDESMYWEHQSTLQQQTISIDKAVLQKSGGIKKPINSIETKNATPFLMPSFIKKAIVNQSKPAVTYLIQAKTHVSINALPGTILISKTSNNIIMQNKPYDIKTKKLNTRLTTKFLPVSPFFFKHFYTYSHDKKAMASVFIPPDLLSDTHLLISTLKLWFSQKGINLTHLMINGVMQ